MSEHLLNKKEGSSPLWKLTLIKGFWSLYFPTAIYLTGQDTVSYCRTANLTCPTLHCSTIHHTTSYLIEMQPTVPHYTQYHHIAQYSIYNSYSRRNKGYTTIPDVFSQWESFRSATREGWKVCPGHGICYLELRLNDLTKIVLLLLVIYIWDQYS